MNASRKTILLAIFSLVLLLGFNTFNQYLRASSTSHSKTRHVTASLQAGITGAPIQSITTESKEAFSKLSQIKENRILKININEASLETLQTLPGVGESTAKKIMALKDSAGAFQYVDDLLNVSGIGEKKLGLMEPYIDLPRKPSHSKEKKQIGDSEIAQSEDIKVCKKCGHKQEFVHGKYKYSKPHCTHCLNYIG